MRLRHHRVALGVGLIAAGLTAACMTEPSVVSPNFTTSAIGTKAVFLCKDGPLGSTATFAISATGGELQVTSPLTLDAFPPESTCISTAIWRPTDESLVEVTVTEIGSTGNVVLDAIRVISDYDGTIWYYQPTDPTVTVRVDATHGAGIRYKNIQGEDNGGTAGCTPGFWKQTQHFQFWASPYDPADLFASVFADAFPGNTLLQVLNFGGGGLNALGRHSVAGLLNAASGDVDYGMTVAEVIAGFNAAYASGDYETMKNIFEGMNESGCTAID